MAAETVHQKILKGWVNATVNRPECVVHSLSEISDGVALVYLVEQFITTPGYSPAHFFKNAKSKFMKQKNLDKAWELLSSEFKLSPATEGIESKDIVEGRHIEKLLGIIMNKLQIQNTDELLNWCRATLQKFHSSVTVSGFSPEIYADGKILSALAESIAPPEQRKSFSKLAEESAVGRINFAKEVGGVPDFLNAEAIANPQSGITDVDIQLFLSYLKKKRRVAPTCSYFYI